MVVKRIISCLAIIGALVLMSCYDVQLDKEAVDNDWAENLSTDQIVAWMGVYVEPVVSKADEYTGEVEISWECPINDTWELAYSADGENFTDLSALTVDEGSVSKSIVPVTIYRSPSYFDGRQYYQYKCKTRPAGSGNIVHYYRLGMVDENNKHHQCYTQFSVTPNACILRITVTGVEADVPSDLYCNFTGDVLFTNITQGQSIEKTLAPNHAVNFFLHSDFSSKGLRSKVVHNSSSSFCKVTKWAVPNIIEGRTVLATLEYNFEDLPRNLIKLEPSSIFDYNDAVFTVDIIEVSGN